MHPYKVLKKGTLDRVIMLFAFLLIGCASVLYSAAHDTQSTQNLMHDATLQGPPAGLIPANNTSIIIRIDDVQALAWSAIIRNLTDATNEKGIPVVLGVIPNDIERDPLLRQYLLQKIGKNKIEVALHGTMHTESEYGNLTEREAYALAKKGLEKIYTALNVYPSTFIPPGLKYSEGTIKALSSHGIRIISAGKDEHNFSGNILLAGYTVHSKLPGNTSRIGEVLRECENALAKRNLCIILVHPQDYSIEGTTQLDRDAYAEYLALLQGLEKTGAKFALFRDLLK